MKQLIRNGLIGGTIFFANFLHAQEATPDSIVQVAAEAQGLSLVSAADVPEEGTFWLMTSNGITVPDPAPLFDPSLPVYQIAEGQYLVDATEGHVVIDTETQQTVADALAGLSNDVVDLINQVQDAQISQAATSRRMTGSQRAGGLHALDDGGGFSPALSLDTNGLFLQINWVTNGQASLNLFNGTDTVYAIWGSTNLATPLADWQVMAELWPTNGTTNTLPFTVNVGDNANLFLVAQDWSGAETNGLPCWWLWEYFQSLNYSAGDLDSQGTNTLGFDYTNSLDPDVITFSPFVTNDYVNNSYPPVRLNVFAGVPAEYAMLVNDSNYADAVWQPYASSTITATLGSADGDYTVYFGLRGYATNATATWRGLILTKDTVPPMVTITNPAPGTVTQPMIQVQGYANEALSGITFDVSNALGVVTSQPGYVTSRSYDTNLLEFTTNSFQCYDIMLPPTNGLSTTITLHVTDLAGNETTTALDYTLDYSGVTNPPQLKLVWPQNNALVSGSNFTLQAQVDDDTAKVTASITDTNGDTNIVQGLVERNGTVRANNLPLGAGTNLVTLTATNAAGLVNTTNFNVVQSAVSLSINPISDDQLNEAYVNVGGSVTPGQSVWVNGVQASVDGSGDWTATNVPVNATGEANLDVEAGMDEDNPAGEQTLNQPQPAEVLIADYEAEGYYTWTTPDEWGQSNGWQYETITWNETEGGDWDYTANFWDEGTNWSSVGSEYYSTGQGFDWFDAEEADLGWANPQRTVRTEMSIIPSGEALPGATSLYVVYASALEISQTIFPDAQNLLANGGNDDFFWQEGDVPLPPEWLAVNGQTLVDTGETNDDGTVSGATLVAAPAGTEAPVSVALTPDAQLANPDYTFNMDVKQVQLHILANGIDLSTNTPEFCVGQAVTNQLVFDPPLPANTPVSYQWSASLDFVNSASPPVNPDGSTYPDIDPTLLTNNPTPMWWYDGGNKYVFCKATVTLPNGQTATVIGQGNVSIFQPQVEFTDGSPAYPMLYNDYMELGDESLQQGNMTFAAKVISTNNFYGTANWTQLNNRTASYPNEDQDTDGEFWLDTSEFYNDGIGNDPSPTTVNPIGSVHFQDAPGVSDVYGFETITDSFKTYLVFQPTNSPNNIWVTLGIVTWGWSATESAFTLTATNVTQATYSDSDQFPTWLHTGTGRHNN